MHVIEKAAFYSKSVCLHLNSCPIIYRPVNLFWTLNFYLKIDVKYLPLSKFYFSAIKTLFKLKNISVLHTYAHTVQVTN